MARKEHVSATIEGRAAIVAALPASLEILPPLRGEKRCRYLPGWTERALAEDIARAHPEINEGHVATIRRWRFGRIAKGIWADPPEVAPDPPPMPEAVPLTGDEEHRRKVELAVLEMGAVAKNTRTIIGMISKRNKVDKKRWDWAVAELLKIPMLEARVAKLEQLTLALGVPTQ
jgi:hypothetical protein